MDLDKEGRKGRGRKRVICDGLDWVGPYLFIYLFISLFVRACPVEWMIVCGDARWSE